MQIFLRNSLKQIKNTVIHMSKTSSIRSIRQTYSPYLSNKKHYNEKNPMTIGLYQANQSEIEIKLQSKKCNVCLNQKSKNEFVLFSTNCGHNSCCKICFNIHSQSKIKEKKKITCPNYPCNLQLDEKASSLNMLKPELKQQYLKLLKNLEEIHFMDCKVKYCEAKIDTRITFLDQKQKCHFIICPKCEIVICFACRHFWDGCICKSDQKIKYQLKKTFKLSQCPKCKIMVQRQNGCEHMKCTVCKQDFCHECSGTWSSGHMCPKIEIARPRQISPPPQLNINRQPNNDNSVLQAIRDYSSYCRQKIMSQPEPFNCLCRSLFFFLNMLLVMLIFLYQILIQALIRIFIICPFQQILQELGNTQCLYILIGFIAFPIAYLVFMVRSTPRLCRYYSNHQFKFTSFLDQSRF